MGAGEGRLGYISMATNNLNELLNDSKGARCVYCFGAPVISLVVGVHVVDESTVLCPLCGIDAVVPASRVPDEATMRRWHAEGWGSE